MSLQKKYYIGIGWWFSTKVETILEVCIDSSAKKLITLIRIVNWVQHLRKMRQIQKLNWEVHVVK